MVKQGYKVYGQENIISNDFLAGQRFISQQKFDEMKTYSVFSGDILITMMGTVGQCKIVPNDIQPGIIDSHLIRLRVKSNLVNPGYFEWVFGESELSKKQAEILSKGSIMSGLNSSIVRDMVIPLPPLEVQKAIASFLDRKTAVIDTLIAKKQRLIQLLEEKRTALINQAVTKGLNSNVPMKDSGISWIGKIPKHWEICPLKYVTTFSGGSTPDKANLTYWNGSIPWVTPKDMKRFWIGDSIDYITELAVQETSIKVIQPPVVLVVVRGMILAHSFPVAITTTPLTINQDMKTLICSNKIITEFIARQLSAFRDGVLSLVQEAGHGTKALRTDLFEKLPILIPPIEEQKAICSHENKQAETFNSIIILLNKQIEKLQEYRQSLITAAVTGKIDVREEVAA
ncbi:MAG: restriction endonuclease subunit S [Nostoc sp.]|uniref:restriction endonuclease subunit S n=1 Tax=Nostoc sp. TaxID=1180 RepID=UPI002FFA30C2